MAEFFQTATPYLLAALAAVGWLYRREYERRVAVEQQVSERKFQAYKALIDLVFDQWGAIRTGKQLPMPQLVSRMTDAVKNLTLYGSDSVLTLVHTWLNEARGGMVDLYRVGEIMVEMRRDMGNAKTKITPDDVLRQIIKDYDRVKAAGQLQTRYSNAGRR